MDALSDVLKTVRLTGAIFFDCSAQAPWVAEQPPREMILAKILRGAEHLIAYHLVMEGGCYANIIGGEPMRVEAGELLVFPHGDPHVLSSSPGMRVDPSAPGSFNAAEDGQMPLVVNYGSDADAEAKFICGYLACDARPFNPLIESLPKVIKIGWQGGDAGWLGEFARVARFESTSKRRGGESVLAKLSELMFIEVLRRYLEDLPPERAGWLAGLRDPFVGKALSLMHERPAQNWTVEELAKGVFVSRSVLAERLSAFRRCSISPNGGSRLSGDCCGAAAISQLLLRKPATDRRPLSAGPSKRWWGPRHRPGAAARLMTSRGKLFVI
jgi:Cupin